MSKKLVSVVVITYNSSKYVEETLDSIYSQTYQNIELIISDDASNDNTVDICKNWVKKHEDRFVKIEIITVKKNTGIPANCNRGVNLSNGEWIKLIAGDDALLSNCIHDNINFVKNNLKIEVLLSATARYIDNFSNENFIAKIPKFVPDFFYNDKITANEQYNLLLKGDQVMTTPTIFIRKDVIVKVGNFDERFKLIEDYPMWLKLSKDDHKLYFMDKVTVKHRVHKNSTNNIINKYIYKPAYFRNETLREELVYPNIHILDALRQKTIYFYVVTLNKLGFNRLTKTNTFIFELFTRFLNPCAYLLYFQKKMNRKNQSNV